MPHEVFERVFMKVLIQRNHKEKGAGEQGLSFPLANPLHFKLLQN